ncbi:unnamed protein product [Linum tenue]|uniref:Uncharacterized protein n=1 Tax=Linum tenue TaxID=586396 RepID=A0AAV0QT44_9ROSI|nr:unnamed protein product [Linum tenue]
MPRTRSTVFLRSFNAAHQAVEAANWNNGWNEEGADKWWSNEEVDVADLTRVAVRRAGIVTRLKHVILKDLNDVAALACVDTYRRLHQTFDYQVSMYPMGYSRYRVYRGVSSDLNNEICDAMGRNGFIVDFQCPRNISNVALKAYSSAWSKYSAAQDLVAKHRRSLIDAILYPNRYIELPSEFGEDPDGYVESRRSLIDAILYPNRYIELPSEFGEDPDGYVESLRQRVTECAVRCLKMRTILLMHPGDEKRLCSLLVYRDSFLHPPDYEGEALPARDFYHFEVYKHVNDPNLLHTFYEALRLIRYGMHYHGANYKMPPALKSPGAEFVYA